MAKYKVGDVVVVVNVFHSPPYYEEWVGLPAIIKSFAKTVDGEKLWKVVFPFNEMAEELFYESELSKPDTD